MFKISDVQHPDDIVRHETVTLITSHNLQLLYAWLEKSVPLPPVTLVKISGVWWKWLRVRPLKVVVDPSKEAYVSPSENLYENNFYFLQKSYLQKIRGGEGRRRPPWYTVVFYIYWW